MPEEKLPRLASWLAARLPEEVRSRYFVPACWDLHAEYLSGARTAWWLRTWRALSFAVRAIAAAAECASIAAAEARLRQTHPQAGSGRTGARLMLMQDLRFALRILRKTPGFTATAIATLALGIGAGTAIFTIVHAVLLQPLPYPDASRIVELSETAEGRLTTLSPPNVKDWMAENRTFERIAPYTTGRVTLTGGFEPEEFPVARASAGLFAVLGVAPAIGRTFTADEERPGGPRSVVLGHGIWSRRFGADPNVLGRVLTLDGTGYEVIAVMPKGFNFPDGIEVWMPLVFTDSDLTPSQRGAHYVRAVGRLKSGVSLRQAYDDLSVIEQRIASRYSDVQGYGVWVQPLLDSMVGAVRRPLLLLFGAVAFVLMIACANVSNLLLARASTRRSEIAVRSALGAGRWRILRQLLCESIVLAAAGGLAGVLLAGWGVRVLAAVLPQDLPRTAGISLNLQVLLFSLGLSLIAGIIFGIAPGLYAATPDLAAFLKDGRRAGGGAGRQRFRSALVALEVALALVLLAGGGLAMRSFDRLSRIDPGFDASRLLALDVALPSARYPDPASMARFYRDYVDALSSRQGVVAAGAVMFPPLTRVGFAGTLSLEGNPAGGSAQIRPATHGYFETLRIPLERGRSFTPADREGGAPVAIVSATAARQLWPGQDPIGQRLRVQVSISGREPVREVVGVAGDVKVRSLDAGAQPVVYVPHAQYASARMTVFLRASADPMALLPSAKAQLALLDRDLAVRTVQTGDDIVAASIAQPRFRMMLLGLFAVTALVLACVGLYGVMAFSVGQRTAELGIRMALGADRARLFRLVLRQGLLPVALGIAAGLGGAALLTQVMSGLLYEIKAFDPATFAAVALLLALVATAAIYVPARRATVVDPAIALRQP